MEFELEKIQKKLMQPHHQMRLLSEKCPLSMVNYNQISFFKVKVLNDVSFGQIKQRNPRPSETNPCDYAEDIDV